jgi:REP element-mobilizing transposase RayT
MKRGYLPHFDANTLVQHVVFRTANSLPNDILERARQHDSAQSRRMIDAALDGGQSGNLFKDPQFADLMQIGLRYFDGDRYDLQAWCIMPNHVHVLLVTAPNVLLGQIVKTWKSQATRLINAKTISSGPIFARDYFDRYIRNSLQMNRAIAYIEHNPIKAGLCQTREDWLWSSANAKQDGWLPSHARMPVFID